MWQQSCLQDGRRLPCSQGKYLGLLLDSQDSLFCSRTHRGSRQELPVPLHTKSSNRGFNLLNATDIDLERWCGWRATDRLIQPANQTRLNDPLTNKVISALQPRQNDFSSVSINPNHSFDAGAKLLINRLK